MSCKFKPLDAESVSGPKPARRIPGGALSAIALGLFGLAIAAITSDAQFAQSLEQALLTQSGLKVAAATPVRGSPPVSGSEAFWLDTPASAPVHLTTWRGRGLAAGDRYQFGSAESHRILEVTEVRQLDATAAAAVPNGKPPATLLMVTLKDVGTPDAVPLRMLVDADAPVAGLTPLGGTPGRDL